MSEIRCPFVELRRRRGRNVRQQIVEVGGGEITIMTFKKPQYVTKYQVTCITDCPLNDGVLFTKIGNDRPDVDRQAIKVRDELVEKNCVNKAEE